MDDITQHETVNMYEEIRRIYAGSPKRDFGGPENPGDKVSLDSFCEVVSALGELPTGDRLSYRIEHEDYKDRIRTRIIAPNENFVEIAIELPSEYNCYSSRVTYKERSKRTTSMKIDLKGLKKKLAQRKLRDLSRTSPERLKKVLGLAH